MEVPIPGGGMRGRRDVPWRRPGALQYGVRRVHTFARPPVRVSAAPADLRVERNVPIAVRDGTVLRANLYLPPGDGPFAVLMSAHPYGKDALPKRGRRGWKLNTQYRIMNQPEPVRISSEAGWEAPDPVWWVSQGFAVMNVDTRGAGTSGGVGSLLSDDEADDLWDVIEWAAAQSWCTGSVGMIGVSYLALSQYKVAALNPPHLKAICPWEGFTDAYRDFTMPGGVRENGFAVIWSAATRRAARVTTDLRRGQKQHPLRDSWWEALTPDLEKITVPLLVCASFSDHNLHSQGSFRLFEQAGSAERFAYTHRGGKWATFYGEQARASQLAFFDQYLRGGGVGAAGVLGEPHVQMPKAGLLPRVRLEVRERGDAVAEVRAENEWPLARTQWTDVFLAGGTGLRGGGSLLATRTDGVAGRARANAAAVGSAVHRGTGSVSFDLRRGSVYFEYPILRDLELTGPMSLHLWVSLDGCSDANLFAGVEKWSGSRYVPFQGSWGYGRDRIADGRQNVALRALDPLLSTHERPVHTFTARQPVQRGEVVSVDIALSASSTLWRAGEVLRLVIAGRYLESANPFTGHFPSRYTPSDRGRATLHWGDARPSSLTVPVIPERGASMPRG